MKKQQKKRQKLLIVGLWRCGSSHLSASAATASFALLRDPAQPSFWRDHIRLPGDLDDSGAARSLAVFPDLPTSSCTFALPPERGTTRRSSNALAVCRPMPGQSPPQRFVHISTSGVHMTFVPANASTRRALRVWRRAREGAASMRETRRAGSKAAVRASASCAPGIGAAGTAPPRTSDESAANVLREGRRRVHQSHPRQTTRRCWSAPRYAVVAPRLLATTRPDDGDENGQYLTVADRFGLPHRVSRRRGQCTLLAGPASFMSRAGSQTSASRSELKATGAVLRVATVSMLACAERNA